jgi:hypothetical protein
LKKRSIIVKPLVRRGLMGALFAAWLVLLWNVIGLTAERVWSVLGDWSADRSPVEAAFTVDELRRPGAGGMLGIYVPEVPADVRVLDSIEHRIRRRFVLISLYQAWGSRPAQQFDPRPLNAILARGAIPLLTWEPWVTDFVRSDLPPMPERQFGSSDHDPAGPRNECVLVSVGRAGLRQYR